jgi:hypothetical protein
MALLSAGCAVAVRRLLERGVAADVAVSSTRPAIDAGLALLFFVAAAALFGWSRTRPERPRKADDPQRTERRITALAFFYLLGAVIFVLGWMAPLSPSAGVPPTWKVLLFAGIPSTLLAASALLFPAWTIRGPLLVPVLAMLGFTLLRLCAATPT